MADMDCGLAGAVVGALAARQPDGGPSGGGRVGGDSSMVTGLVRQRRRHLHESNVSWLVDQHIAGSWYTSQGMPSTSGYWPRNVTKVATSSW